MTLKYESEILFDLMKREGDDTPSDVLPYESELKEKYLKQVEGAYPKLQDYRSEWLNYNLVADVPADFPYVTLSNVTRATIHNVVPYAYRSAILKGQTMVNVISGEKEDFSGTGYIDFMIKQNLKANTAYTAIFKVETDAERLTVGITSTNSSWNSDTVLYVNGNNKILLTTTTETAYSLRIRYNDTSTKSLVVTYAMLIEGDHTNVDIPYFEGMASVQMPVLTTTGKNLFNGEWELGSIHPETGDDIGNKNCIRTKDFFVVESNKEYTISNNKGYTVTSIFYDYAKNLISTSSAKTFITPSNSYFVKFRTSPSKFENDISIKFQIEQGSISTSYETYKANILTVNEDVTLRSNGSVYDELDLLTGKLTQRIDEDGSVLTQEVVKTVDLSVTDQDGNSKSIIKPVEGTMQLMTDGAGINPLFSGEIPVEAITQNLMSFANIVEEEK